jgi:hypothetical protein
MRIFRLYVKLGDTWEMACSVQAADPDAAVRDAVLLLKPEHRGKPMALREEGEPPPSVQPPDVGPGNS